MRTEINPILTDFDHDLSQDMVVIHFWETGWCKKSAGVGRAYDGSSSACLVLKAVGDSVGIFVEIEHDKWDNSELVGTTKKHIPLEDVFDVEVEAFGDNPDYSNPPVPYARWLRNRDGQWRRLDLT